MEAERALRNLESFRRHDDVGRIRASARSLAITTVTVKHRHRFGCGVVSNRAPGASAGKGPLHASCLVIALICFCSSSHFLQFHLVSSHSWFLISFGKTCSVRTPSIHHSTSHQQQTKTNSQNKLGTFGYFTPFFCVCFAVFSKYAARLSSDPSQNLRYSSTHCAACLSGLASNCISCTRP